MLAGYRCSNSLEEGEEGRNSRITTKERGRGRGRGRKREKMSSLALNSIDMVHGIYQHSL